MDFSKITNLIDVSGDVLKRHSPLILAATAIAGVATTAIFAAKAAPKARDEAHMVVADRAEWRLKDPEYHGEPFTPLTHIEWLQVTWKIWIPTVVSGALTVTAIVLMHQTHKKRYAALTGLYVLGNKAFEEYQEAVEENVGKKDRAKIKEAVAEKAIARLDNEPFHQANGGDAAFYDGYIGRPFFSDVETIRRAVNDFNAHINNNFYGNLNLLYEYMGLPAVDVGYEVGWNSDRLVVVEFNPTFMDDAYRTGTLITFDNPPIFNYHNIR